MLNQALSFCFVKLIIDGQDGTARITEDMLNAKTVKGIHQRKSTSSHSHLFLILINRGSESLKGARSALAAYPAKKCV